jgi:hypothetical protein
LKKKKITAVSIMLAAAVLIWFFVFLLTVKYITVLVIEPFDKENTSIKHNNKELVFSGLEFDNQEESFVISYTHSVNKGRVKDYYAVKKSGENYILEMFKTRFLSYGAGMSDPEENEVFLQTDDYIEISGMQRQMPFLVMAVGVIADHCIEIESHTIMLTSYFTPQQRIKIQYKKITLIKYLESVMYKRFIEVTNIN